MPFDPCRLLASFLVLAGLLTACGDDTSSTGDGGADAADATGDTQPPDDSGPDAEPDAEIDATPDAVPPDPCRASEANSSRGAGCNGPIPGPDLRGEELGGQCGDPPHGTCEETCVTDRASAVDGICTRVCDPRPDFVAAADCPEGFRCFAVAGDGIGFCLPDCERDADCATGVCWSIGGCGPTSTVCGNEAEPLPLNAEPAGITYDCRTSTGAVGTTSGMLDIDRCPEGEIVVGFEGLLSDDGRVGALRLQCSSPVFEKVGEEISIFTDPTSTVPPSGYRGGGDVGRPWVRTCPSGEAVTGLRARTGVVVSELTFRCTALAARRGADGYSLVRTGAAHDLEPVGLASGGEPPELNCGTGTVAYGVRVRSASVVTGIAVTCADIEFR